jgi:GntR family transcriptional repressor for pyruvate dehydrogenase complex
MAVEQMGREGRARPAEAGSLLRFVPIHQLRAHEYVAEQIRRHIALRLIKPGESLPSERDLAVTFGVGRPTIQNALRLLEAEHMVEARRGRNGGTFVSERSQDGLGIDELILSVARRPGEIEELLTFRRVIEPAIAADAAQSRYDEDLAMIRETFDAMARSTTEPDYMRHDTEFHIAVARATHNRFLIQAIEDIRMGLNDAMTLLPETEAWHSRIDAEHEALLQAVTSHDAEAAREIMQVHVANSEQSLRAVLKAVLRRGGGRSR